MACHKVAPINARAPRPLSRCWVRTVVHNFVDDWGEAMLGPLAEPLLSGVATEREGGGTRPGEGDIEGLSDLWPRLARICEAMEDLEASRTKVELARQMAVDRSNPESIAHALGKVGVGSAC